MTNRGKFATLTFVTLWLLMMSPAGGVMAQNAHTDLPCSNPETASNLLEGQLETSAVAYPHVSEQLAPGETATAFAGMSFESVIKVTGVDVRGSIGDTDAVGVFVLLCVEITVQGDADRLEPTSYVLLGTGLEEQVELNTFATAVANGFSPEMARGQFLPGTIATPLISVSPGSTTSYALAFDVPDAASELFLAEKRYRWEDQATPSPWAIYLPIDEVSRQVAKESKTGNAQSDGSEYGAITKFDQEVLIHVGMPKWFVTVHSGVEVRYSIAGITPERGQFLVVWFDQRAQNATSMPLGNFQLKASAGPGTPEQTYSMSRLGTEALILTEYTWNPNTMDSSSNYRTGVVFDIRPEDTHFVLEYDLGQANEPWGPRKPIRIEFTA